MFCIFVGLECAKDFDLVFVIDSSGSIVRAGFGNFQKIKDFVKDIVNGFNIGFDKTHVGAVIFSSSASVRFGLDDYYSKSGINSAIDKIVWRFVYGKRSTLCKGMGIHRKRRQRGQT